MGILRRRLLLVPADCFSSLGGGLFTCDFPLPNINVTRRFRLLLKRGFQCPMGTGFVLLRVGLSRLGCSIVG
jgi:hypothetical protein